MRLAGAAAADALCYYASAPYGYLALVRRTGRATGTAGTGHSDALPASRAGGRGGRGMRPACAFVGDGRRLVVDATWCGMPAEPRRTGRVVMATRALTKADFTDVTGGDGIVLVDFWATWCPPCLRFAPTYERVSAEHPDIVFAKVDTEAEPELAIEYGIHSIPTIMAVRDGVLVFQQAGALPEAALQSLISQVRALDMDDVRARAGA